MTCVRFVCVRNSWLCLKLDDDFDVVLTKHLSIILAIDQRNAHVHYVGQSLRLDGHVYAYVDIEVLSSFVHKRFVKSCIIKVKCYLTMLN